MVPFLSIDQSVSQVKALGQTILQTASASAVADAAVVANPASYSKLFILAVELTILFLLQQLTRCMLYTQSRFPKGEEEGERRGREKTNC